MLTFAQWPHVDVRYVPLSVTSRCATEVCTHCFGLMQLQLRTRPLVLVRQRLRCNASIPQFYTHSLCPYAQRVSLALLEKGAGGVGCCLGGWR